METQAEDLVQEFEQEMDQVVVKSKRKYPKANYWLWLKAGERDGVKNRAK